MFAHHVTEVTYTPATKSATGKFWSGDIYVAAKGATFQLQLFFEERCFAENFNEQAAEYGVKERPGGDTICGTFSHTLHGVEDVEIRPNNQDSGPKFRFRHKDGRDNLTCFMEGA